MLIDADPGECVGALLDECRAKVLERVGLVRRAHDDTVDLGEEFQQVALVPLRVDVVEGRDHAHGVALNREQVRVDREPATNLTREVHAHHEVEVALS